MWLAESAGLTVEPSAAKTGVHTIAALHGKRIPFNSVNFAEPVLYIYNKRHFKITIEGGSYYAD